MVSVKVLALNIQCDTLLPLEKLFQFRANREAGYIIISFIHYWERNVLIELSLSLKPHPATLLMIFKLYFLIFQLQILGSFYILFRLQTKKENVSRQILWGTQIESVSLLVQWIVRWNNTNGFPVFLLSRCDERERKRPNLLLIV